MAEYKLTDLLSAEVKISNIQPKDLILVDVIDLGDLAPYLKGPNKDEAYSEFSHSMSRHAELIGCEILHVSLEKSFEWKYNSKLIFNPLKNQ